MKRLLAAVLCVLMLLAVSGCDGVVVYEGKGPYDCATDGCFARVASSYSDNCALHSSKCQECARYISAGDKYCSNCKNSSSQSSQSTYTPSYVPTPRPTQKTFTNKYGTETTICAVSGCSKYIATSGDTNCCTSHSNRCIECNKYIDGDALCCMDCIEKALGY